MSRILIVDDEHVIRRALRKFFERHHHQVSEAGSVASASEQLHEDFDVVLADVRLPDGEGTELLRQLSHTPVIVMTSYASVRSAVAAMRDGAFDYISKPFDHDEMLLQVDRALRANQLQRQNSALKLDLSRSYPTGQMIGHCRAMTQVFRHIAKCATVESPVLILGESGTGKQLAARALHEHSARAQGPFVLINCASLAEGVAESELFGHAGQQRGLVESAHLGTLFLHGVGELSSAAQARLLHLLESQSIRAVGSSHARPIDLRVVAASDTNLAQRVADGAFREDLFYRLRVIEISLPALRERGDDVQALAEHFLQRIGEQHRLGPYTFDEDALKAIRTHPWPGNVRELHNAIERAVILSDASCIAAEQLGILPGRSKSGQHTFELNLDEYFRQFVLTHQGQMTETDLAERLGLSRKALWERRQRMNIPRAGV